MDTAEVEALRLCQSWVSGACTDLKMRYQNLRQGYCAATYHGQVSFPAYLAALKPYTTSLSDPFLRGKLAELIEELHAIGPLNQSLVDLIARFLTIPIPLNKRMARFFERMLRQREDAEPAFLLYWTASTSNEDDRALQFAISESATAHYQTVVQLHSDIDSQINALVADYPIVYRDYPTYEESDEECEAEEAPLPPFKPLEPPTGLPHPVARPRPPLTKAEIDAIDLGDQRAKDLIQLSWHRPTEQRVRMLRGALRFGRTGGAAYSAFYDLAQIYEEQQAYDEALEHYDLCIGSERQQHYAAHMGRGRVRGALGRLGAAKAEFQTAIALGVTFDYEEEGLKEWIRQIDEQLVDG